MARLSVSALLLSLALVPSHVFADEGTGHVSIEGDHYLIAQPAPVATDEGRFEFEYNWRYQSGDTFSARVHPFVYGSTATQAWARPVTVDPRELYVQEGRAGWFARAGFFTLSFEGTDGFNPMDIAAMKDLGNPLAPYTRASAGLHVGHSGEKLDWEAAWIPVQTPSSLPGEASAWWPRNIALPLRSENIEALLPSDVQYQIDPRQTDANAFANNLALRAQLRSDDGDLSIAAFDGAADVPVLHPILSGVPVSVGAKTVIQLQSPVEILPIDYRRRTVAGLLSVPKAPWIFRLAGRYDQPYDGSIYVPTWSSQLVAGVERSFTVANDTVTLILQYSWAQRPGGASLMSLQDIYKDAVLLGLRWPIGETWSILASGFSSVHDGSWLAQATLARRWENGWSIEAGLVSLDGPATSLFGSLKDNDRAILKTTRSF